MTSELLSRGQSSGHDFDSLDTQSLSSLLKPGDLLPQVDRGGPVPAIKPERTTVRGSASGPRPPTAEKRGFPVRLDARANSPAAALGEICLEGALAEAQGSPDSEVRQSAGAGQVIDGGYRQPQPGHPKPAVPTVSADHRRIDKAPDRAWLAVARQLPGRLARRNSPWASAFAAGDTPSTRDWSLGVTTPCLLGRWRGYREPCVAMSATANATPTDSAVASASATIGVKGGDGRATLMRAPWTQSTRLTAARYAPTRRSPGSQRGVVAAATRPTPMAAASVTRAVSSHSRARRT